MKFAIVVVVFALAYGANSSVVPLLTTIHGGQVLVGASSVAVHASAVPVGGTIAQAAGGPLLIQSAPIQTLVATPHVVAVAAPEGTYVAKNRGAVHVAPLPGHSQSTSSVNLEPAPGTW